MRVSALSIPGNSGQIPPRCFTDPTSLGLYNYNCVVRMLGSFLVCRTNHCRIRFGRRMIPGPRSCRFFIHSRPARTANFAGGVPPLFSRVGTYWLTLSVMHDARTPNACPGIVATLSIYRGIPRLCRSSALCLIITSKVLKDRHIWSALT